MIRTQPMKIQYDTDDNDISTKSFYIGKDNLTKWYKTVPRKKCKNAI